MQLGSASAAASPVVLVTQTIDMTGSVSPGGVVASRFTDRELRLAGARGGIDTFTSVDDAIAAARSLSAGEFPGLAVMQFRGGYRIHDVHAASRTYRAVSPDGIVPPQTTLLERSSVPFAAGNLRWEGTSTAATVRSANLVALVDGSRTFVSRPAAGAGAPLLEER